MTPEDYEDEEQAMQDYKYKPVKDSWTDSKNHKTPQGMMLSDALSYMNRSRDEEFFREEKAYYALGTQVYAKDGGTTLKGILDWARQKHPHIKAIIGLMRKKL